MLRLALLLLCFPFASVIRAGDAPEVYSRVLRSTAWIRTTTQGVGTGWVVDTKRRWLITNLHIVGDQDRVEAFFVDRRDGKPITERQHYLENQKKLHDEGKTIYGKVIARREISDLALIELEKLPESVAQLPLAIESPGPGTLVQSVGNRHDSEALWLNSSGVVRQEGLLTDGYFWRGKKLAADMPCLIAQLPIHPGDSGGAVVNVQGEVVGIVSGGRWRAPLAAIVIQAAEVRKLLAQVQRSENSTNTPKSNATEIYRKLSAATVWVRPGATEGRGAGWIVDRERRLVLTTSTAAGASDLVDVVFPLMANGRAKAELEAYADHIGLRQSQHLVRGLVLARDPKRDLALIELESMPASAATLPMATNEPAPADRLHAVSHPLGVELLWLYASASVRQAADVELVPSSMGDAVKCRTLLLQVPHQAGSAGGPVTADDGQVVGMLAAKEGAQQQLGYAIASQELRGFLDSARPIFAPKTAVEFQRRSRYLLARGQLAAAGDTIGRALDLEPKNAGFRRDLVEILIQARKVEKVATQAAFLNRDNIEEAAVLARALFLTGKREDVAALCEQVLNKDRKCAVCYMVRGAMRTGKEGLPDLDDAIFHNPTLVEAYRLRAETFEKIGDERKAIADWSRAIELSPYSLDSIRARARLYRKRNEPKRAVADYERLIELQPQDVQARRGLASSWLAQGDEAKAIPALVAALRLSTKENSPIFEDIRGHGVELTKRWPDDPGKKAAWYEQALKAIRAYVDPAMDKKIGDALAGRMKEWNDKTWGDELEKRIKALLH